MIRFSWGDGMAFIARDENGAENSKQHLNLSAFAYEVLSYDMFAFGEEKLSGFLNTVFEYYYPQAEASISLRLNDLQGMLSKTLDGFAGDIKTKERIIKTLVAQKKDSLLKKAGSYEKGISFKFWINKKNLEYLTQEHSECCEELYYPRRGQYIKCVIEEYARLPYIERELVFFKPFVDATEEAIREEKRLRVVTGRGSVYSVYPYKILHDPLSTANYLVGCRKRYDCPDGEKLPCSFKLSALASVRVERSKSAFMREREKRKLVEKISSRGVQFMVGNEAEIHVRLTDAGICKYRRQAHLRPALLEKRGEDIFVFRCTTAQAEFYFFKFGRDAEILLPLELRKKFISMYEHAADVYRGERG